MLVQSPRWADCELLPQAQPWEAASSSSTKKYLHALPYLDCWVGTTYLKTKSRCLRYGGRWELTLVFTPPSRQEEPSGSHSSSFSA